MSPAIKLVVKFFVILQISARLTSAGDDCYKGQSDSPTLPPDATLGSCNDNMFCSKTLTYSEKNIEGERTIHREYSWGCYRFPEIYADDSQCGDSYERSLGSLVEDEGSTFTYTKLCTCCGDRCNGAVMDQDCVEEPAFTHNCWSGDSETEDPSTIDNPNLPAEAFAVGCSANQLCLKRSIYHTNDKQSHYFWECSSVPGQTCESSWYKPQIREGVDEKVCMCCGNLCNGADQNWITADNAWCNPKDVKTTTPQHPGEPAEDYTAVIVSCTVIGVLLIGAGLAIFFVPSLRAKADQLVGTVFKKPVQPDQAMIVQNDSAKAGDLENPQ